MSNKIKVFVGIIVIAVIMIIAGFSLLCDQIAEKEPMTVAVVGIERAEIVFGGGLFAANRVESMPYIIAETENGETIKGIIDISTLDKGDKIIIIEDTPGQSQEFKGYKWYKFVGYQ